MPIILVIVPQFCGFNNKYVSSIPKFEILELVNPIVMVEVGVEVADDIENVLNTGTLYVLLEFATS